MLSRRTHWLAAALVVLAFAGATYAEDVKLETENDKMMYALGMMLSARMPKFNPTPEELQMIVTGVTDGLKGQEPRIDMSEYATKEKMESYFQDRVARAAEAEDAAGTRFREEMAQQQGAETLDSGVIYIEEQAGTGAQPGATDSVKVHYTGTLRDGTVFDSSVQRGEPAEFSLENVVACFSQGLMQMKVGGKAKLVCPPELAYGNRGTPRIPPGATLVFELELLDVTTPEAADQGE
jgi:FKBP-type peptidyl-prolyl cis-trans isomerase